MSGVAGAVVGLTSGAQPNIAGAQALVDGTTTGRGCTTNFIGFGQGLTSQATTSSETGDVIEDFNATDDTVTLAATSGTPTQTPTYVADDLTWVES